MTGGSVIGREEEREAIGRWLDAPRPASLLIDGEAGIGKSTLWDDALEQARTRADRVIAWRASVAEREMAFAVLTGLLADPDAERALVSVAEPRRGALEVALGRIPPGDQPVDATLVGLGVGDILCRLAVERPLTVAIDDIQWADRASHEALAFAARRLRDEVVAFIVARRTDAREEAGSALALAAAVARQERVEVGPLSVGALGRLIHERLAIAHPRPLLVRLHEASSGNPFHTLEISRSLKARALDLGPGEPFPIPPQVGPLVRDHLASLSREARRAMVIVAMSPDPRLDVVEEILGDAAGRAIDEACAQRMLVEEGSRLRGAHPLYLSTAYADAPPAERRALRRALGKLARDPVERAVHVAAVAEPPDAAAAETISIGAAGAVARGAPALAADLYERAAQLDPDPDGRARITLAAADAAAAAGDTARAEAMLRRLLEAGARGPWRARTMLALGDLVYVERPTEALPLLISALEHTEGDPILEALAHSYISSMADMDPAAGHRSAEAAAAILERTPGPIDPDHLACALLDRAFHVLLRGEGVAVEDIDRGLALLTGDVSTYPARRAQEVAERCLWHLGRLPEAIALDEVAYRRLSERGQVGLLPPLLQSLSVLHLMNGDWTAARRYGQECLDLVEQGEAAWRERAITVRARLLAWTGDLDAARALAAEALEREEAAGDRWEATILCALLGFVELSVPDPDRALQVLLRALEHNDAMEIVLPTQFRFLGDLVEAAVLAGDVPLADRILRERLEGPSDRLPLPWVRAMAARGRGLVSAARGDQRTAVDHLDRSVHVFDEALPMPFERARTVFLRGRSKRALGLRREARADLDEAWAVFHGLGAGAWEARAAAERGRISGRAGGSADLTPAERAVAELAAAGRSNREIAAELVLSVRTVESQLSVVYRKLDLPSRARLAAALASTRRTAAP
jgi:DNA-binding CsgD family transcriptional regulator